LTSRRIRSEVEDDPSATRTAFPRTCCIEERPTDDDLNSSKQDHPSYIADYAYSEIPPDKKPADTVLDSLKDIPTGTPIEEIKRASDAFGLDFNFMKAVAKIESGFDPKQRTGSYTKRLPQRGRHRDRQCQELGGR
jgi:hypothetical protein